MSTHECRQLIVGLPSSGKTTFIASLWHVVHSAEVEESLQLLRYEGDLTYLNAIAERWRRCEEQARTNLNEEQQIRLSLRDPASACEVDLRIPDLSGETYRQQFLDRRWTVEFRDLVDNATGFLVFVHPRKVVEPVQIRDVQGLAESPGPPNAECSSVEGPLAAGHEPNQATEVLGAQLVGSSASWDPESVPTQVKVVDLLQFVATDSECAFPARLAVVVSAWDLVERTSTQGSASVTPDQWLGLRMPLLDQYLRANPELFTVAVFGVSAQGGDYPRDAVELRRANDAGRRIKVRFGENTSHDITLPIKWLMQ